MKDKQKSSCDVSVAGGCLGSVLSASVCGVIGLIVGVVKVGFWSGILIGIGSALSAAVVGFFVGVLIDEWLNQNDP